MELIHQFSYFINNYPFISYLEQVFDDKRNGTGKANSPGATKACDRIKKRAN